MSSNPFRRSQVIRPSEPPPSSDQSQEQHLEDAPPGTPPKRTKQKRVQIQTPPHSPEALSLTGDGNRRFSASFGSSIYSPPPPGTGAEDGNFPNTSSAADAGLEQARINTKPESMIVDSPSAVTPNHSGIRAPYNPFARTLATAEASYGLQSAEPEEMDQGAAERHRVPGRPAMDVDMFTSILLTGSAPPVVAGDPSVPGAPRSQGSSAGTDASTHSRQTLFDSGTSFRDESPRTSLEGYESASSSDADEDNEEDNLMGSNRPQETAPPALPKPKTRGPQTVSFADFDQSIPPRLRSPSPPMLPMDPNMDSESRPHPVRSQSDLNKPLPPPPAEQSSIRHRYDDPSTQSSLSDNSHPEDASQLKKIPPPPPASRRQAASPGRPRSASNTTQDSAGTAPGEVDRHSSDSDSSSSASDSTDPSTKATPPPPPPSRKAQPQPQPPLPTSHSQHRLSSHSPARNPSDAPTTSLPPSSSKPMPPPPPRRHPSKSGRHTSGSSNSGTTTGGGGSSSTTNSNRPSFETSRPGGRDNLSAPPPPPPRRGGGGANNSKRASLDGTTATAATRTTSGADGDHPVNVPAAAAAAAVPQRDLLADLTAFQAEIDALRAKTGAGSEG